MLITSRQHPLVKLARSLHPAKGRKQHRVFLAEGGNALASALRVRWPLQMVFVADDEIGRAWAQLAEESDVPVQRVDDEILKYIGETETSPDVIAIARIPRDESLWPEDELLLVLDGLSDPGNVGTLIRGADAAGVSGILATQTSSDAFAPKTVRASAGSLFNLPPLRLDDNTPEAIVAQLQKRRIPIVTAEAHDGIDCFQFDWSRRCALVLGHETRGVSHAFSRAAAASVTIPIFGRAESLNVAMAGTILMYAWRQGHKS